MADATRLIRLALDYRALGRQMRARIEALDAAGIFERLAEHGAVDLTRTDRGTSMAISNRIGTEVRRRIVDPGRADPPGTRRAAAQPLFDLLDREDEAFRPLDMPGSEPEGAGPPDARALAADLDADALSQIAGILDPEGNHRQVYAERLAVCAAALHGRGDRRESDAMGPVFEIWRRQDAICAEAAPAIAALAPDPQHPQPKETDMEQDQRPTPQGRRPETGYAEIADAVSRLQDSIARMGPVPGGGGALASFDRHLDDMQYAALNVPSLASGAVQGIAPRQMADKIFAGLAMAVERRPGEIAPSYVFRPGRIRVGDGAGGGPRGGAAVIAREIAAQRPLFVGHLRDLVPERHGLDVAEADRTIAAADDAMAELAAEASATTGPIGAKADALIEQLCGHLFHLIWGYGIGLGRCDLDGITLHPRTADLISAAEETYDREDFGPNGSVAVLDADANDEALKSLIQILDRVTRLFHDPHGTQTGTRYARLMARLDAMGPSAQSLRQALAMAGLSGVDQKAAFGTAAGGAIELDRLIGWIESYAARWRGDLADGRITRDGLSSMARSLDRMGTSLEDLTGGEGPSLLDAVLPRNAYGIARREFGELSALLAAAAEDAHTLGGSRPVETATKGGSDD